MATRQQIIADIDAHIKKQGGQYSSWYVGITADIEERVYGEHKVPREGHWRIHREADSAAISRAVEKAFLDAGCKGGPGGGDDSAVWVYAYLITANTVE